MQTTLRIDDGIYREAKSAAARKGMTLTRYIESALSAFNQLDPGQACQETEERNQLMEALLKRTAHFRIGKRPSREERNER